MTDLERRALARIPLTAAEVSHYYSTNLDMTVTRLPIVVKELCESHERLRLDLQGAEAMLCDVIIDVSATLTDLDNWAARWGDEGILRSCRDRLRNLFKDIT